MSSLFFGLNFGPSIEEIVQDETRCVLKVENETGEGVMTCHKLFPGVVVMYSDFHMSYCDTSFQTAGDDLLCVDHCRRGCMERAVRPDHYYYLAPGHIDVDSRNHHAGRTVFPQAHFHGVSIAFYLPEACAQLSKELAGFPISLPALQKKFCADGDPHILRRDENIRRVFDSMYQLPRENQREFLRLKAFELLLYLDALSASSHREQPYLYKSQVEKTKAAERLMMENLAERYTIEALSRRFSIPQSALKHCFKVVFGLPIHTYLQEQRIRQAAQLLRTQTAMSVAQISGLVGYDSPGKFSAMFKRVYGVTPREYRNGGSQ